MENELLPSGCIPSAGAGSDDDRDVKLLAIWGNRSLNKMCNILVVSAMLRYWFKLVLCAR